MARSILGRRRAAVGVLVTGVALLSTVALTGAFAGTSSTTQVNTARQQFAQHILKTQMARFMTWPAQVALHIQATGNSQLTQPPAVGLPPARASGGEATAAAIPSAHLRNVRVNNPRLDTHQTDQTTQSETTIAVAGRKVAVGYNDSQQSLLRMTAGSNLTGYSYSRNGGRTFTDGGTLPNAPEFMNFGDPWMGSDRAGTMYYSTLALEGFSGNLEVAVARSTNGGKTWSTPVPVFNPTFPYSGDKDALAVEIGRAHV